MLILGDVFAIALTLIGAGFTAWALLMAGALVFPRRSAVAEQAAAVSPIKRTIIGALVLGTGGLVGLTLLNSPLPAAKLLGLAMLLTLLAVAFLGLSGVALGMAHRLRTLDPSLSAYGAWAKASAILVACGFFPFLGWFLVAPALLAMGLGVGMVALLRSSAYAAESV